MVSVIPQPFNKVALVDGELDSVANALVQEFLKDLQSVEQELAQLAWSPLFLNMGTVMLIDQAVSTQLLFIMALKNSCQPSYSLCLGVPVVSRGPWADHRVFILQPHW